MRKHVVLLVLLSSLVFLNAQLSIDVSTIVSQSAVTNQQEIHLRMLSIPEEVDLPGVEIPEIGLSLLSGLTLEAITFANNQQFITTFGELNPFEQRAIVRAPTPVANPLINFIGLRAETPMLNFVVPWQLAEIQRFQRQFYIRAGNYPEREEALSLTSDLRSLSFAKTESTLLISMTNSAGQYPSLATADLFGIILPLDLFMYGVLLLNPDQLLGADIDFTGGGLPIGDMMDLEAYVLFHYDGAPLAAVIDNLSNLPFLPPGTSIPDIPIPIPTTGLYRLQLSDFAGLMGGGGVDPGALLNSFDMVGEITTDITAGATGSLIMGVDFETLVAQPGFGEWPSTTGILIALPFILQIDILGLAANPADALDFDFSMAPTIISATPYRVNPPNTTQPVVQIVQTATTTNNTAIVSYRSEGGFYPVLADFRYTDIDGDDVDIRGISASLNFLGEALFVFEIPSGVDEGRFRFSASGTQATTVQFVRAEDPDTCPGCTDPDCPDCSTSDDDRTVVLGNDFFSFYPNPIATNELRIDFKSPLTSEARISIFNVRGQRVRDFAVLSNDSHLLLNNLNLESGIYFIRVANEEMSQVRRLTVIK